MKILLGHCVDWRLGRALPGHDVRSARDMRWEHLKNGELLALAAQHFDVMLTVDRNIRHQQRPGALPLAVVVLVAKTNRLSDLLPLVPSVDQAMADLQPGAVVEVSLGAS